MHRAIWLLVPTLAIVCIPSLRAQPPRSASDTRSLHARIEYEAWMRPYRVGPLKARFGDEPAWVKLVITALEGDEQKPNDRPMALSRLGYWIKYGCSVSIDGRLSYFSQTAMGSKGSGYPAMPEADRKRLDELLADLPDDFSYLPPPDRRLVLQAPSAGQVLARVYDRANAPEMILEILRLTQSGVRSRVLTFQPKDKWTADGNNNDGALTISPDGRRVVSAGMNGPFRFWDPDSHAMMNEIPRSPIPAVGRSLSPAPIAGLTFSPDGSVAVVEGWGEIDLLDAQSLKGLRQFSEPFIDGKRHQLSNPQFTPDGGYLLLQSSQPALLVFETKNWRQVSTIPGMPAGALAFFPAPRGQRSVYLTGAGEIALWNPDENRNVALLDENGRIVRLAYSPDEAMVAVVTLHHASERSEGVYRVRIWNTENGALVQELRPFEQKAYTVEGLLWWPDGTHVLAVTKSHHFFTSRGVGIWSVKTGRHRGELIGCPTNVFGLALLRDGRLVEGCGDGVIRVWDTSDIIQQLSALETSLADHAHEVAAPAK